MLGIRDAAEHIGFRIMGMKIGFVKLKEEAPFPQFAHWNQELFVVVYKIEKDKVWVADPARGKVIYTKDEFLKSWTGTTSNGPGVVFSMFAA